jgi:hypothetical protein
MQFRNDHFQQKITKQIFVDIHGKIHVITNKMIGDVKMNKYLS